MREYRIMFFDDFDALFKQIWNTTTFNRKEMYDVVRKDNKLIIAVPTLGISKDDLRVTLDTKANYVFPILKVEGETDIPTLDKKYSISKGIRLSFPESEIESLKYYVENGIAYIILVMKTGKKEGLIAERLDDELDF